MLPLFAAVSLTAQVSVNATFKSRSLPTHAAPTVRLKSHLQKHLEALRRIDRMRHIGGHDN